MSAKEATGEHDEAILEERKGGQGTAAVAR